MALGLHRRSQAVVLQSLAPIALGHALAIVVVAAAVVTIGLAVDPRTLRLAGGAALLAWALYHLFYGARHRTRIGMQTGLAGLILWSFLMASAHGAGLMLVPALIPLCLSPGAHAAMGAADSRLIPLAAVGIHTLAMLLVSGTIAIAVYTWMGVGFLRRGWINLDRLWIAALSATGLVLLLY